MNERIKLLAIQAKYDARSNRHYLERVHNREITLEEYQEMYDQKFAELIVRECAGLFVDQKYMILNPHEPFANERVRALKEHDKDTVRKIKGHFGVEE